VIYMFVSFGTPQPSVIYRRKFYKRIIIIITLIPLSLLKRFFHHVVLKILQFNYTSWASQMW
jgi:hypothetical protein